MASGSRDRLDLSQTFDVLVVGGGNAALCAAMTAQEAGAQVLMLESSPQHFLGGNRRHTRNLRYLHEQGNEHLTGPYLEDEFWDDLMRVTEGLDPPKSHWARPLDTPPFYGYPLRQGSPSPTSGLRSTSGPR